MWSESDTDVPIWKSGEKIDEIGGALPAKIGDDVENSQRSREIKFVYVRLAATVATIDGVFALLKYKAEIESKKKANASF